MQRDQTREKRILGGGVGRITGSLLGRQGGGGQGNQREGREWIGGKEEWRWAKVLCLRWLKKGWSGRTGWDLSYPQKIIKKIPSYYFHHQKIKPQKLPARCHIAQWNSGSWCHLCRLRTDLVPGGCPLSAWESQHGKVSLLCAGEINCSTHLSTWPRLVPITAIQLSSSRGHCDHGRRAESQSGHHLASRPWTFFAKWNATILLWLLHRTAVRWNKVVWCGNHFES